MYTEASSPRSRGDKARLISPTNPATAGSCVEFWYHMYGTDVGTLNVFARTGSTLPRRPIWSENGNQGNAWKVARKTIVSTQPFEVGGANVFFAGGSQGDQGVDPLAVYFLRLFRWKGAGDVS